MYPAADGIIDFLGDSAAEVREEIVGNREVAVRVRADADDAWLLGLPESFVRYVPSQLHHNVRADFDSLLASLGPSSQAVLLDLGAGCCWTSRFLAEAGFQVIANDISSEKFVGLGSGDVYIAAGTPMFGRMLFDMSARWPFADGSLDAVVAFCSIHHAHNLSMAFNEAARVLKPGGTFSFIEAGRGLIAWPEERSFGAQEQHDFHANEHKYNALHYRNAARRAGFSFRIFAPGSFKEKLERIAVVPSSESGDLGTKYRVATCAIPVLRWSSVRRLLTGRLFPAVCALYGAQFLAVCERAGPNSRT